MSDALRAENERLREECDRYKAMYENIHVTAAELRRVRREWKRDREQNAKLRKLVHWMYDRMDESCAVQHPYAPAPISYDRLMQAAARARELGVEVGV